MVNSEEKLQKLMRIACVDRWLGGNTGDKWIMVTIHLLELLTIWWVPLDSLDCWLRGSPNTSPLPPSSEELLLGL